MAFSDDKVSLALTSRASVFWCGLTVKRGGLGVGLAMTCNLAFNLDTSQRAIMLGIQQMAELSQLLVDRVLEQVSPAPEG